MRTMTTNDILKLSLGDGLSSSDSLSVVGIGVDDDTWKFLKVFADNTRLIRLLSRLDDYHDREAIERSQSAPDICLVDFDRDRRAAVMAADRLHSGSPATAVFAISSQSYPDSILDAMRSGCSEYLSKPIQREQLVNALSRIGARRKEKKDQSSAQVLGFIGSKGGCGVTTVVTQMAAILSKSYARKTMVVDLHPDFGDAALYLKLSKPTYHFFELCDNTHRLDADLPFNENCRRKRAHARLRACTVRNVYAVNTSVL